MFKGALKIKSTNLYPTLPYPTISYPTLHYPNRILLTLPDPIHVCDQVSCSQAMLSCHSSYFRSDNVHVCSSNVNLKNIYKCEWFQVWFYPFDVLMNASYESSLAKVPATCKNTKLQSTVGVFWGVSTDRLLCAFWDDPQNILELGISRDSVMEKVFR